MRKNKIIVLMLVLGMMFSAVLGCGNSNQVSDESDPTVAANVEATVESTVPETTTEEVMKWSGKIQYSYSPISEETRLMLIEKLSNLRLVYNQEFDMSSLTFKENEQEAFHKMKSILAFGIASDLNGSNILKCKYNVVELYKIDCKDDCMVFWFKQK